VTIHAVIRIRLIGVVTRVCSNVGVQIYKDS